MSNTPPEMPDLSPEQIRLFTPIIDSILAGADLTTITPKKIILGLQEKLGYDITEFKKEVKKLINQRFDVASAKQEATNSTSTSQPSSTAVTSNHSPTANGSNKATSKSNKRPSPSSSTSSSSPPPAKKFKSSSNTTNAHKPRKSMESLDAELAARLQAEENGRARSTRGGSGATSATVRKRGTPTGKKGEHGSAKKKKRVSKATLDSADDSELDGTGSEVGAKKKITTERKGGFHKPMVLSQTLSEFFGGEEKLSRPECVKRIWAYIKEHDLQDPKDRRQIRCDDKLRRVFKQDRVTMFNMNKHLSFNLYPPEEV